MKINLYLLCIQHTEAQNYAKYRILKILLKSLEMMIKNKKYIQKVWDFIIIVQAYRKIKL